MLHPVRLDMKYRYSIIMNVLSLRPLNAIRQAREPDISAFNFSGSLRRASVPIVGEFCEVFNCALITARLKFLAQTAFYWTADTLK